MHPLLAGAAKSTKSSITTVTNFHKSGVQK